MKKLALPLAFLLLLPLPGRAESKKIHEQVDPYSHLRTLMLEVGTSRCSDDPPSPARSPEVHLLFSAFEGRDHTVSYYITPELDHGNLLNVRDKGTLDALIDGEVAAFTTSAGSTVVNMDGSGVSYLHETVPYQATQADLAKIARSQHFQFRVNGPKQTVQRCTDARRLHDLAEFLDAAASYGAPAPTAPVASAKAVEPGKMMKLNGIDSFPCPGSSAADGPQAVSLTFEVDQGADRTVKYFIIANLMETAPLGLRGRGTLETKIDGVAQSFHAPHASRIATVAAPNGQPTVQEAIAFHVQRRDLIALSRSAAFEFRIDGGAQPVQRCTDASHMKNLAAFVDSTAALYDHPVALASASGAQ